MPAVPRTALLALAVVTATSCGDDGGGSTTPDAGGGMAVPRGEVLAHLGTEVILPAYRDFVPVSEALVTALDAYAAAPSPATRMAAQEAWAAAMDVWERVEMMQIGPLGMPFSATSMVGALGGEDRRVQFYAWPQLNTCVVDQRTAGDTYDDPAALEMNAINERGLGAVEYLIFVETAENTCSALSSINADGTWASFTPEQVEQRRARLAHSYAVIVHGQAEALVAAWDGGFLTELTDPTRSGAVYGTAQEGLNAVSDAMFYLDKETKDLKLGAPAEILASCTMDPCGPGGRESRWANRSKEHILNNLLAFQSLYLGGAPGEDGLGFDDLLVSLGAEAFAEQMATNIADAIVAVEAIPGTLVEALASNRDAVVAAHAAIKLITDDLKSMFLTVLDLEVPARAAGDTD